MSPEEYARYKRVEEAERRKLERSAGASEQLLGRLAQEYGCGSLEEARKLVRKLDKEGEQLDTEIERIRQAIDEEYADKLEGV